MNLNSIRLLDRYPGQILCYLFSGINNGLRLLPLARSRPAATIKKIAFIKLSEIGAIILAYPFIQKVKETYPEAQLYFITGRRNIEMFELLGDIVPRDNILTLDLKSFSVFAKDTCAIIKRLYKEKIDLIFDMEMFSRFTALLCFFSGAAKKVGFGRFTFEGLYRGNFYTHKVQYNPLSHVSQSYMSLLYASLAGLKDSPEINKTIPKESLSLPVYEPDQKTKDAMMQRLLDMGVRPGSRLLLFNPGEGIIPVREWPLENFKKLAQNLLGDDRNVIILVGTEDGQHNARHLVPLAPERCFDFYGRTTLKELMALFYMADALVTNDCGLAHLATLSRIKKFIFFGPEHPQIFGPLGKRNWILHSKTACSPCLSAFNHRNSRCRNNVCLQAIHPDDVTEVILREL